MTKKVVKQEDHKAHWAQQIYFYLAVFLSILFLAIGSFQFLSSNLKKFVFTKIGDADYSYMRNSCENNQLLKINYDYMETRIIDGQATVQESSSDMTDEEVEKCLEKVEEQIEEEKAIDYQEDMMYSLLMIVISTVVLVLHLKYMKPAKEDK